MLSRIQRFRLPSRLAGGLLTKVRNTALFLALLGAGCLAMSNTDAKSFFYGPFVAHGVPPLVLWGLRCSRG